MSLSYPYTLEINGVDLGSLVEKYGWDTSYTPVYSDTVTTLDKVDHNVIVRWRHGLNVKLRPLSETDLATIQSALFGSHVASVTFSSLQLNADVTCRMSLSPSSAALVLKNASRRVLGNVTLSFAEL